MLWGLYYFAVLFVEKLFLLKALDRAPKILRHIYSLLLIVLGWVIFACDDITVLLPFIGSMFGANGALGGLHLYWPTTKTVLLIICCVASTELPKKLMISLSGRLGERPAFILKSVLTLLLLGLSMVFLIGDSYNPFLYFRF